MQITQGLRRAVQLYGQNRATVSAEGTRTWEEVGARVARLAGALRSLGLRPGGRVAMLGLNSPAYLEFYYAVPWAGGCVVPLNHRLAVPEIAAILRDCGAEILIVDDALAALGAQCAAEAVALRHVIHAGPDAARADPADWLHCERLIAEAAPVPDAMVGGAELAGIFYTGGTTGAAKGVMLTHDNLVANTLCVMIYRQYQPRSVYLHAAPMFHLADLSGTLCVTLAGGCHAFIPRFEPLDALRAIQDFRVTICTLVPTMLQMLVGHPDVDRYNLSSLEKLLYGASPMPRPVLAAALQRLPDCLISQGYGMTETSPVISMLDPEYHTLASVEGDKMASAGLPAYHAEVRIVGPDDGELPRGSVGEIVTRGPHVMRGYWNQPELTAQALRGGWMHTGDLGYMDDDGFLYIVDRLKDMIITGGENVYSLEVERAIQRHPGVAQCAVIGIPDEKWGEAVHAIVVPKPASPLTPREILRHCRQHIGGYKCPRSIEIRHEALALSGAGKVAKHLLREAFWSQHGRRVN